YQLVAFEAQPREPHDVDFLAASRNAHVRQFFLLAVMVVQRTDFVFTGAPYLHQAVNAGREGVVKAFRGSRPFLEAAEVGAVRVVVGEDRKSTRLNSSHVKIS